MATPMNEKRRLKEYAEKFKDKLIKIKVVAFDIDGILTDGGITWWGEDIGFNRTCHIHDGYGFKILRGKQIHTIEKRFSEFVTLSLQLKNIHVELQSLLQLPKTTWYWVDTTTDDIFLQQRENQLFKFLNNLFLEAKDLNTLEDDSIIKTFLELT